ncbi:MAG: hypothetical protein ACK43M_22395 [Allorhizobium sp.]
MSQTTTIKLSRRYEVPGAEPFDSITLREANYNDLFLSGLGKPFDFQVAKGIPVRVAYPEIVDQYVMRLIKSPDYSSIGQIAASRRDRRRRRRPDLPSRHASARGCCHDRPRNRLLGSALYGHATEGEPQCVKSKPG